MYYANPDFKLFKKNYLKRKNQLFWNKTIDNMEETGESLEVVEKEHEAKVKEKEIENEKRRKEKLEQRMKEANLKRKN